MKIYENPMRFTDFRRNYCAPGNLSCKVWYLFPVVICYPFFSSHPALFMVVLVGEPNSTDTRGNNSDRKSSLGKDDLFKRSSTE